MAFLPSCCKCGLRFTFRGGTKSEAQTPLLLLCGHVFCYSCLKKDLTHSSKAIVCFKCQTKTKLEESGSLKYLEQDIYCLGLCLLYQNSRVLDIINSKTWKFSSKPSKSISSTPVIKDICTECNEKEAECLCDRCDALMCNPCFAKVHSTSNVLKRHRAVDLSEFPRQSPFTNDSAKKCDVHSKLCDYFCEDDNQYLCSDCLTTHKRHNILTTKDKKEHQLEFVKNLEKTATADLTFAKSTKQKLEAFLQKIEVERDKTLLDVQRRFHFFHCLLQCREKILKDKVNSTFSEMANALNNKVQSLVESIQDAESNLIGVHEAINNSNHATLNCEKISEVLRGVISSLSSDKSFGGDLNISSSLKEESNLMNAISVLDFCCNEILPEIKNAEINKSEVETKVVNVDKCEILNSAAETLECRADLDEPPLKTKDKFQSISIHPGRKCILVTHVENPSDFYVRSVHEGKRLESLTKEFNNWCNARLGNSESDCDPRIPDIGDVVFGKFGEDDIWYRARITDVDSEADAVDLLYVDYGNVETVSFDRIFAMPEKYQKIPAFAIHCCLANVVSVHGEWNAEDIQAFLKLSTNKPMELSVLMETKYSPLLVDLSDSEIPSVCDSLVFLGHAGFTNAHKTSEIKASNKYPQQSQYPSSVMPKENLFFTAAITFVYSPGRFFIQEVPCNRTDGELPGDLSFACDNKINQLNAFINPSIGDACIAKYSEDGLLYRGEILKVINPGQVVVKYVDFGNDEILSIWDIRKINDDLIIMPAKALECCLADLIPVSKRDNQWNNEAIDFLKQFSGKMIEVIIKEVLEGGVLSVYLKADCAANTVNTALVDLGWAKFNLPGFYGMHTGTERLGTEKLSSSLKIPFGEPVNLEIIEVTSPSEFYVQLPLQKIMFQKLCEDIQKHVTDSSQSASSSSSSPSLSSVLEGDTDKLKENWCCGDHCLVWNPDVLVWSRASVVSLNFLNNSAGVCCYDYGSKLETSIFKLRSLPDCFRGPPFCTSCRLAGVLPSGDSSKWSQTSIEAFSALIGNKNYTFEAVIQEIDGTKESVEAELFFNCGDDDDDGYTVQQRTCASQYLRDRGLALPMRIKKNKKVLKEIEAGEDVIGDYPQLVPHGSEMCLCFTHVSDEGIIYGQEWSPGISDEAKMLLEVNERYENSQPVSSKLWKEGELTVCKFHKDGLYYRAKVLKVDETRQMAQIVFVDYGNKEDVCFGELRPPMFLNTPVSCHACELKGVEWIKLNGKLPLCSIKFVEEALQKSLNFTISISEYLEDSKKIVGDIFLQGGRPLKDLLLEAGIVKPFGKVLDQKMENSFTSVSESTSDDSDVIVLEEEFNHGILNPNEGMDEDTSVKYFAASPKGPDRNSLNSQLDSSHSSQSSRFCVSQKFEDTDNNNKVKESFKPEMPLKVYDSLPPFKNYCALNALLPKIGWTIHGTVVAVNSLGEVFIQICSSENDTEFSKKYKARLELLAEMTAYYQNNWEDCSIVDMKCLTRGLSCLAKGHTDNKWHRAKIHDLVLGDNAFSAEIVFVDYGYSNRISELDKIRILPEDHLQVPNMAVRCHFDEKSDDKNGDLSFLLGKTISLVVKDVYEKSFVEISVGGWSVLPSHISDGKQ